MPATRRIVLARFFASATLPGLRAGLAQAEPPNAPPQLTPACNHGEKPTVAETEGPYFKPNAPLKRDFTADTPNGERITLAGFVLDRTCRPIPKAIIQIWHADATGKYDTSGYRLRGYQFTDDTGRWWLSTIVPSGYAFRTRHYHFKVQPPGELILTTQLYFPGEPMNRTDWLFDARLQMHISEAEGSKFGRFDFVV
jgi:protocatechuate 3,4-dioxygenase beta subunit